MSRATHEPTVPNRQYRVSVERASSACVETERLAPLGGNDVVQLFDPFQKAADIARGLTDALLVPTSAIRVSQPYCRSRRPATRDWPFLTRVSKIDAALRVWERLQDRRGANMEARGGGIAPARTQKDSTSTSRRR
jgi:hypothetical protein